MHPSTSSGSEAQQADLQLIELGAELVEVVEMRRYFCSLIMQYGVYQCRRQHGAAVQGPFALKLRPDEMRHLTDELLRTCHHLFEQEISLGKDVFFLAGKATVMPCGNANPNGFYHNKGKNDQKNN